MIIQRVFANEVLIIEKVIDNMAVQGCIANFENYLDGKGDNVGTFEKKYIDKLNNGLSDFVTGIFLKKYVDKSATELLGTIRLFMLDGYSAISEWICDDSLTNVLDRYTDDYMFELIQKYMRTTLEATKADCLKSKEQAEIVKLEKELKSCESTFDHYTKKIEELKAKIDSLKKT